jgi:Ca2+:H+ antiporter
MPAAAVTPATRAETELGRWLTPLNVFLLAVPVAVALKLAGVGGAWMFAAAGLAIVPLAGVIGRATEALAAQTGPGVGGLFKDRLCFV